MVAGRALRKLRAITTAVQQISATNLHERLALTGPDDELKELGDTFDALVGRLEASFAAQRRFVANASHELRTPLARQRTVGQVALADPDASIESLQAAHERVLAAGAQQEQLIEALLTLARGQAGVDRNEPFDLATLAERVVASRRAEAQYRDLAVYVDVEPAPGSGDPRLVERLVTNLVDNALRHNIVGGCVVVRTRTRARTRVGIVDRAGSSGRAQRSHRHPGADAWWAPRRGAVPAHLPSGVARPRWPADGTFRHERGELKASDRLGVLAMLAGR
jgi:signal transduction histidine kinase